MNKQYRQWVEAYQDQAWTLARYILKDASEAEDVCQEAFVKLWHHRDRVDEAKIKPWLMKVTRNACLDRLRRRRPTETLEEWHQPVDTTGPMHELQQQELGQQIKGAIAMLGEPYRSLVILRDIHQHTYEEVANVLELSLSQVRVYLHRARKQLREDLAEASP